MSKVNKCKSEGKFKIFQNLANLKLETCLRCNNPELNPTTTPPPHLIPTLSSM